MVLYPVGFEPQVSHVCQVEWNKGHALNHLLDSLNLDDMADVMPIYIGDDRTDEDAFAVLKQKDNGVGILVSTKVPSKPYEPGIICDVHYCPHW